MYSVAPNLSISQSLTGRQKALGEIEKEANLPRRSRFRVYICVYAIRSYSDCASQHAHSSPNVDLNFRRSNPNAYSTSCRG